MAGQHSISSITRRNLLRYVGASLAGPLGPASTFGQSAQKASELRLLFPGGSWKNFYEQAFANQFAQANDVRFVWRAGHRFAPILIAQGRNPQWDLMHGNQTDAMQLRSMGFLQEWNEERIPNLKDVHPSFRYPYLAGKVHTPFGLVVNTKQIKRPIDSWHDLWDPEFTGKVAVPEWGWLGEEIFHAINIVLGGNVENADPGMAKFKELFRDRKAIVGNNVDQMIQLLFAEEIWIAPFFSARTLQARAKGAPVEFIIPKEGGLSWIFQTAIVANRPRHQQEVAEKLVNFTLEPERQVEFAKLTGYPPTNVKAMEMLPADRKDLILSSSELEALGKLQSRLDYMAMLGFRDQYSERWNKEVLAS